MCYNQTGNITTLDGASLKLVDKFTYLGSSVSSTENDIDTRLTKAWTAIDRLSIIWKSDLTDKLKRSFFQAAVVSILLYGCTTWTLTKRLEKKLDGNYTRMLRAVLNNSWRQHPTRHQLYGHLRPITKTIQVMYSYGLPHMAVQKQDDQLELTYSNYVRTQDREKWRERVRDIRAGGTTWWWYRFIYLRLLPCSDKTCSTVYGFGFVRKSKIISKSSPNWNIWLFFRLWRVILIFAAPLPFFKKESLAAIE